MEELTNAHDGAMAREVHDILWMVKCNSHRHLAGRNQDWRFQEASDCVQNEQLLPPVGYCPPKGAAHVLVIQIVSSLVQLF